ncbi:family 10 glycosylhydrolase [Streptomyces carpaticus]|uniref:Family 10 glycosylhydrolase n=1 Tax=Streptomyces carpaticus TaxID=285558 RepID=A0ABV4ZFQ3_9ACTN
MRRIVATLLTALSLLLGSVVLAGPARAEPPAPPPEQWRSYWVDAFNDGIYTPEQVSTLIDDALGINANVLIVQTARRYDCFCNRALYPRTDAAIAPAPYDPLDEVIAQAHAAGLQVHAWVNVNTLWNSATPPRSADHVFNRHGPTAEGRDRWLNRKADGTELQGANSYIDPGHPDAAAYIVEAIRSLVREYDVDGINLDYIRYPDGSSTTTHSDWGYNEVALERFRRITGRTDTPAPDDAAWSQWRRDQVTSLVRRIYIGMWEEDPSARLSVNAITYGFGPQSVGGWQATRAYAEVLQDWAGWLAEGITDTVVTMNYKRDWDPDQAQMYSEWTRFLADAQSGRHGVTGPALYLNPVEGSLAQLREALAPTPAGNTAVGWSGYSYANPSMDVAENGLAAERERLTAVLTTGPDAPFAEPAAVPGMTWKSAPRDGHVTGELALRDGTPLDQARVTLRPLGVGGGTPQPVRTVTDGSGWFGFAHAAPGRYLLTVDLPTGVVGVPVSSVVVREGRIAEAPFGPFLPVR